MNTPAPGAAPQQTPVSAKALPTVGSVLGSVLGAALANAFKLDPVSAGTVIAGTTALVTAAFQWVGSKIGTPL